MKQFGFLLVLTAAAWIGAMFSPFWALLVYYLFAVLRPDYLWEWALPTDVRWSLLVAMAAMLGTILNLPRLFARFRVNAQFLLMLSFGVMLIFSCLAATNTDKAQHWAIEYAKVLIMAMLAHAAIERLWHIRWVTLMIFAGLGYICWEINALYFFDNRLDIYHVGFGGFDNNSSALFLAMGIPFALYLVTTSTRWVVRIGAAAVMTLMVHAVLLSYSRGAMLAVLCGVVWHICRHRARGQAVVLTTLLVVTVGVLAGPEIRDRFMSTRDYHQESSAQSRLLAWEAAWHVAWQYPLTGRGIRNSAPDIKRYGQGEMNLGGTIHNQYLQIAADSGIPAAVVYIMLLGGALMALSRARRLCHRRLEERPHVSQSGREGLRSASDMALCVQSSLVIFAVGCIFLSIEVLELAWLLFVLAGRMPDIVADEIEDMKVAVDVDRPKARPAEPGPAVGLQPYGTGA